MAAYDNIVAVIAAKPVGSRTDAAWTLANAVADWWPGWLGPLGVECHISAGPLLVIAPAEVMVELGGGRIGRRAWFDRLQPAIG